MNRVAGYPHLLLARHAFEIGYAIINAIAILNGRRERVRQLLKCRRPFQCPMIVRTF